MNLRNLIITLAVFFASLNALAYDFKVGGIYYNLISPTNLTCEVTYSDINNNTNTYTGNLTIPESVVYNGKTLKVISIGECAFWDCSNLQSVDLPETITSIEGSAFQKCSAITRIVIPASVTRISGQAFWAMKALRSICFDDGKENLIIEKSNNLPDYPIFYSCSKIDVIHWGRNIYSQSNLFADNIPLSTLTIGRQVTVIDPMELSYKGTAFANCSNLRSIDIYASTPPRFPKTYYQAFPNTVYMKCSLLVPSGGGCKSLYEAADVWKNFWFINVGGWSGIGQISVDPMQEEHDGIYYDLRGVPVSNPIKGEIYIYKGKKIVF